MIIQKIKVNNMLSPRSGRPVANQFEIHTPEGTYFQSYNTVIAFRPFNGKIVLDHNWDCSRTTGKYRNEFLGENTQETRKSIKEGHYLIKDLN